MNAHVDDLGVVVPVPWRWRWNRSVKIAGRALRPRGHCARHGSIAGFTPALCCVRPQFAIGRGDFGVAVLLPLGRRRRRLARGEAGIAVLFVVQLWWRSIRMVRHRVSVAFSRVLDIEVLVGKPRCG